MTWNVLQIRECSNNLVMMSGSSLSDTETLKPELEQLKHNVAQLREELAKLRQQEAAMALFIIRARKRNFWVVFIVLIATAIGWLAGGSVWLRLYVLPVALLLCGLFSLAAGILSAYTARKITKLETVAATAEVAISQLKM